MHILLAVAVLAAPEIPELLKPWVGWVLHDKKQDLCPQLHGQADERQCVWPARLELVLDKRQGVSGLKEKAERGAR